MLEVALLGLLGVLLPVAACRGAFRAGEHRAMARVCGVLTDALDGATAETSAIDFAVRVRHLLQERGLAK
jgi:hypothetical protein